MILRVHPAGGGVEGSVEAPPSKSYTHRAVFAALLACGESVVLNPLLSGDTRATIGAARRMGARLRLSGRALAVEGVCGEPRPPGWVYCAGSGTTLRIATAVASLIGEPVLLYGDSTLRRRPMKPLLDALAGLGVESLSRDGYPPVAVRGPAKGEAAEVDASISSQFASALLFIAPLLGATVRVRGRPASRPYIDLTLKVLEAFGAEFERSGYSLFKPRRGLYRPAAYRVPGDYSSASFMLAAGAIGGRVRVHGLDPQDAQADRAIVGILRDMGARVRWGDGFVEAESTGALEAVEVDLRDSPDLAPVVAALAAHARGVTMVRGVGHLSYKESDRLESITGALRSIGVEARSGGDWIEVKGGRVRGGRADSRGDHRIAMMLAIAAIGAEAPVEIVGAERIGDSYPSFTSHLSSLGVRVEVVRA